MVQVYAPTADKSEEGSECFSKDIDKRMKLTKVRRVINIDLHEQWNYETPPLYRLWDLEIS